MPGTFGAVAAAPRPAMGTEALEERSEAFAGISWG